MSKRVKNDEIKKDEPLQAVIIDETLNPEFKLENKDFLQCLLPVANIPIIDYGLSLLSSSGIKETIFVCTKKSEKLEHHIQQSKWNKNGSSMRVKIITAEGCQSLGDAMRELDIGDHIHGDFILMYSDTVSNLNLHQIIEKHKSITEKDKGAVMTLIYTKALPKHELRNMNQETVLALDSRNGKILFHKKVPHNQQKVSFPVELFLERPCLDLCYDLLDPVISICTSAVPPLFSDNFDFQTRDDFIKGLLMNEDILGNTMYVHCLENKYAARVGNLSMYHAINLDVINRWTYPYVPDTGFSEKRYLYLPNNNVYKGPNVLIGRCSSLEDSVIGEGTRIGTGCNITSCVIGKNCTIGNNVTLEHALIWDNSVIDNNFSAKYLICTENSSDFIDIGHIATNLRRTEEGYGSETDNSDDDVNVGGQQIDEYEVFFTEVLDSLVRGFVERVEADALIIEINASRFANNIPAEEVNHWVFRAMLNVPEQANSTIDKVLPFFLPILSRYFTKSDNDQHQCLSAIESELLGASRSLLSSFAKILMFLYKKGILEEDSIIAWYRRLTAAELKDHRQATAFVEWLENAEEESGESSE